MTEEILNEEHIGLDNVEVDSAEGIGHDTLETVALEDRGFYTTSFEDYTVTEGLLLLIFVILLVDFFVGLVRRWF